VIVSERRRVVAWNPAAAELIGANLESAATCCDVFGCRRAETGLADTCVTELALARGTRLTEIVVRRRQDSGNPLSVSGTPLAHAGTRTVVFHIRVAGTAPAHVPMLRSPDSIRIRTLGETVLETARGEIRNGWLDQRSGLLLKFLVARRYEAVHADEIAEALWPRARADTTSTLRHFVHTLREQLEPDRGRYQRSAFVLARHGGYMLNPEHVSVDADAFEREARAGLIAVTANEPAVARERLRKALDLYRGDFLVDERFADWAIAERERLRDLAAKPLRTLARLADDLDEATGFLERLAAMEPLDVEIHRDLIAAWLHQGRRGRAIRHYRALQSRLMRELGERLTLDLGELGRTPPDGLITALPQ
jgi:DNA-binding SARP family transcriptional activator